MSHHRSDWLSAPPVSSPVHLADSDTCRPPLYSTPDSLHLGASAGRVRYRNGLRAGRKLGSPSDIALGDERSYD